MISFFGDVALLNDNLQSEYTPENPYIFNLEYVLSSKDELKPVCNKVNIKSDKADFKGIFGSNPLAVCIANNHLLDYGAEGYYDTIANIHKINIETIGDKAFYYKNKVCILAYTLFNGKIDNHNFFSFDKEKALCNINNAKKKNIKTIIVNIHWGVENNSCNNNEQSEIGRWLIDNGVDLVIGHHPHCIQNIELYKGKYIFYSLGNSMFPNIKSKSHYDSHGIPQRNYRLRWMWWNRKSFCVTFDEERNRLVKVDELYLKGNRLICKERDTDIKKYMKQKNYYLNKIVYNLRKYFLFAASNCFTDGELFDLNAILNERRQKNEKNIICI